MGKLFSKPVVLANIYGPNWDDSLFFSKLNSILPDLNSHQLILGGDFNCVLHVQLDKLRPRPNSSLNLQR